MQGAGHMKKNHTVLLAIILLCIATAAILAGCTSERPDPETGVNSWTYAVNNHDYDRVYDLAPLLIRQQVSRPAFISAQSDNPLLSPGNIIQGYTVVNKTISGNDAAIVAQLVLHVPAFGNESARDIPLYIKFLEVFDNGQWNVWTTQP